ncbi:hypothetical protein PG994_010544 [Apiospora phragmitis]|uniref:Uncharacterized protein n=1 Tax=Apiospora phragmitis TaxID=2905665 RepID=A0ABR1TSU6_9PEZI
MGAELDVRSKHQSERESRGSSQDEQSIVTLRWFTCKGAPAEKTDQDRITGTAMRRMGEKRLFVCYMGMGVRDDLWGLASAGWEDVRRRTRPFPQQHPEHTVAGSECDGKEKFKVEIGREVEERAAANRMLADVPIWINDRGGG